MDNQTERYTTPDDPSETESSALIIQPPNEVTGSPCGLMTRLQAAHFSDNLSLQVRKNLAIDNAAAYVTQNAVGKASILYETAESLYKDTQNETAYRQNQELIGICADGMKERLRKWIR